MVRGVMVLWLTLALAPACWGMGSRGEAPTPVEAETTVLQRLAAAEAAGEIDAETAVEYRVYAVKAAHLLPERFRGGRPMKDATGVLRQARARFDELRPEVQARLEPLLFPRGRR